MNTSAIRSWNQIPITTTKTVISIYGYRAIRNYRLLRIWASIGTVKGVATAGCDYDCVSLLRSLVKDKNEKKYGKVEYKFEKTHDLFTESKRL